MNEIVSLSSDDRASLFNIVAARKGIAPELIEKDFWVCWLLKSLFSLKNSPEFTFKGGTSLSKGYGIINRFSEDIDITLDRKELGFLNEKDPYQIKSRNQRNRILEELKLTCNDIIKTRILPILNDSIAEKLSEYEWGLEINKVDPQSLEFYYPQTLKLPINNENKNYMRQFVYIEFGIRGEVNPSEIKEITPYALEEFPLLSVNKSVQVKTLLPIRTFWEKATLLHAEHYRPIEKQTPLRLSRHYYDLCMLWKSGLLNNIQNNKQLLNEVAHHKSIFFASASAHYEKATLDQIKLIPNPIRLSDLRRDYEQTKVMLFRNVPGFEELMEQIITIENTIHKL